MIKIKPLAEFPTHIPELANIWVETIGKKWLPNVTQDEIQAKLQSHINRDILPMAFIAMDDAKPIGMCALRIDDGANKPELMPWLGSLCLSEQYKEKGIGKLLIKVTKSQAFKMGFKKLYLSTFDPDLVTWYEKLGWSKIDKSQINGVNVEIMCIAISYLDRL
ncbi:MAG UNVERIFIED_CONTAM: GNAT family N-acetyltransferase [Rickettsiaceae bacterium]|jgi:N-acetylglutamate synthase-like GNAT family acetyltransferase